MQIYDLLTIFILLIFAWLWWWDRGIKQHAFKLCKQQCERSDVQLLDDNIHIKKIKLIKNDNGELKIYRQFSFEFTYTSEQRYLGTIELLGKRLLSFQLAPYQI